MDSQSQMHTAYSKTIMDPYSSQTHTNSHIIVLFLFFDPFPYLAAHSVQMLRDAVFDYASD